MPRDEEDAMRQTSNPLRLRRALAPGGATTSVIAVILVAATALPVRADAKKFLLIVPRAMHRTAVNMITFRDRETAALQWLDIAATLADAETTRRAISRGSTERNPFLGRRPSGPHIYGLLLTVGFGYATMTQVIQDRVERPRPFTIGLASMATFAHAYVAYHNTTICPGNLACNPPPAN
jgi:hypothetical protein